MLSLRASCPSCPWRRRSRLLISPPTPASNPTSEFCSGRPSTSSTAPPPRSNGNSTTTSRCSGAARRNRTARNPLGRTGAPLTAQGQPLIERGTAWSSSATRPPSRSSPTPSHPGGRARSSKVSHRNLTSTIIYSRDFLAARRRAENEVLLPRRPQDRLHRRARVQ